MEITHRHLKQLERDLRVASFNWKIYRDTSFNHKSKPDKRYPLSQSDSTTFAGSSQNPESSWPKRKVPTELHHVNVSPQVSNVRPLRSPPATVAVPDWQSEIVTISDWRSQTMVWQFQIGTAETLLEAHPPAVDCHNFGSVSFQFWFEILFWNLTQTRCTYKFRVQFRVATLDDWRLCS